MRFTSISHSQFPDILTSKSQIPGPSISDMATMEEPKKPGQVSESNLPEWETTARHRRGKEALGVHYGIKDRAMGAFDRYVPAHRKYCGLSRKTACIVLLVLVIAILALIIGLAVGLSKNSRYVAS